MRQRMLMGWKLASVLLAAILAIGDMAIAQIVTTTVSDTVYHADGSLAGGSVVISWPAFTTVAGQAVSAASITTTIGAGGLLNVQLAPNAGSNPMGSYYTVVYHLNDGSVSKEYWVVPVSATPVKISAIRSTVMPLSVAQTTVSKSYVDQAIAQAVAGGLAQTNTSPYVMKTGDTMTGPLVLPGDPVSPYQAADKNYVDTVAQQGSGGGGQKVSLVPQATQVVVQPVGTQLQVDNLNGVEYATQYVNGQGNNGIANAVASTDCANGCEVKVEQDYNSAESYVASTWNNKTHVEDARQGATTHTYTNPGNTTTPGLASGETINLVATQNPGIVGQTVVSQSPSAIAHTVSIEAPAGGSNLYPASIEPTVPYFKSNYVAQELQGTFNTLGQHSLSGQYINCYGVGDCLIGARSITASGGFRDEADEGAHPFDLTFHEDTNVFTGSCASGCTTGATSLTINPTAAAGTQGEGRFLIDKNPSKVISSGLLTGGVAGTPYPSATFTGTSFPTSVFFSTAQQASSQANNVAPGTVTLPIATSGVTAGFATNTAAAPAASGIACVVDQNPAGSVLPHNYEMANYAVVDGTHLRLTLNKVHAAQSTVAIGGLCGYGLEQVVDTQNGIRQVFPVVGSYSASALYYAGGATSIVGVMNQTSGFLNVSANVASIARSGNTVTLTATGNFSQDINGLVMTVSGVSDSSYNGTFTVTTTGPNTLTYAQTGPNSSSTGGSITILTGGYALYPMAEVLGVMNPATKQVDGQVTLAPNTVAWAGGDAVEQPHYYEERVAADVEVVGQTVPRPTTTQPAGVTYDGNNAQGLLGWQVTNATPATSYLGGGGNHTAPTAAFVASGVWQQTMQLDAGQTSVFNIHCNYRGCGRWNSTYDLFDLQSNAGVDTVRYQPQTSTLDIGVRGTDYIFTPQALTAGTINATTINAGTIKGQVSGNSITSGAVSAAYLPLLGASGASHAAGIAPDPGSAGGATRFLREDGTWSFPGSSSAGGGGNLVPGATADYNFLQGTGTVLLDTTGSNNNGTLVSGALPTWTPVGLSFLPGQTVSLPSSLNGTQTFVLAIYINPLTAGQQIYNQYPVILSASQGGAGTTLMYNYTPTVGSGQQNFITGAYAPTLWVNNQVASTVPNLVSGFHVLGVVLGGGGGLDHIYIDGVEAASYTAQGSSAGQQTIGTYNLGSSPIIPWNQSGINGTMYRLRTYPTALSAAQVQSVTAAITSEVASRGVATTPVAVQQSTPQLQAIGDSITYGLGVATPWPSLLTQPTNVAASTNVFDYTAITPQTAITSDTGVVNPHTGYDTTDLMNVTGCTSFITNEIVNFYVVSPTGPFYGVAFYSGTKDNPVYIGGYPNANNDTGYPPGTPVTSGGIVYPCVAGANWLRINFQNNIAQPVPYNQAMVVVSTDGTPAVLPTSYKPFVATSPFLLTNQPPYTTTNWGISGITALAINGSDANRAALKCRSSSGPSMALVFAGTNDFTNYNVSASHVLLNLVGEVQTLKQAGCKVFVGTMLSRVGNDYAGQSLDSDKDAYDALILSQAKASGADGVIDFAANPLLGADGANAGAYFLPDHIHPTEAGQALLAAEAANVLNYTFGYNETNPHVVTALNYAMTAGDGYVSLAGLTSAGTMTLPDCTGQSGAMYRINNPQSAFAVSVVPLNASQAINGLSTVTVPANATLTLRDVPNPKTVAGCHWEM